MPKPCTECGGKKYRVSTRDDGRRAVERCDECCWFGENDPRTISDEDVVHLAVADGIRCEPTYPCVVLS